MEHQGGKSPGIERDLASGAMRGDQPDSGGALAGKASVASLETGDLYARAGDHGQALRTFESLWKLPVFNGDLRVGRRIAYCMERLGRFGDAIAFLRPLLAAAPAADVAGDDERVESGRCRLILGKALFEAGRLSEAQAEGQLASALLRGLDAPEPGFVENLLGTIAFRLGDPGEARVRFRAGLEHFRSRGDVANLALSYTNLGTLHRHDCEWERALEHYQAAYYLRATEGEFQDQGAILLNMGIVLARVGRIDEARGRLQTALNSAIELSNPSRAASARLALIRIARMAGEFETAREQMAALAGSNGTVLPERTACQLELERINLAQAAGHSAGIAGHLGEVRRRVQRMASRGDLMAEVEILQAETELEAQDFAAAGDSCSRALDLAREANNRHLEGQIDLLRLEIAVRAGDVAEADRLVATLLNRYQRGNEMPALARLFRLRGRLDLSCRRNAEAALSHYSRSLDLWKRMGCPRNAALLQIRCADTMLELGRIEEARELLRDVRSRMIPEWSVVPALDRGLRRLDERIRKADEDRQAVRLSGESVHHRLEDILTCEMGPGEKLRSVVSLLAQALEAEGAVLARIDGDSLEALSTVSMGRLRGRRSFAPAALGLAAVDHCGVIEPPAGEEDNGVAVCALSIPVHIQGREHLFYLERRDAGKPPYTRQDLDYAMVLISVAAARLRPADDPVQPPGPSVANGIWLADVVTQNARMLSILELIRKVAQSDLTVLLQGETGTGKKLLAQALHRISERRSGPFVTVDCAALPDSLLESELFGHCRGAFTGAIQDRTGLLEEANGGTIFLDEIDKAGLGMQRRFLHMLDSGEIRPVGATTYRGLDVRVVCATSSPELLQEVADGHFLKDLYYRLNDISIVVPPLRERPDDVPLLAEFFLEKCAAEIGRRIGSVASAFHRALADHTWPGNVRELEKAIRRAVTLAEDGDVIGADLLPAAVLESSLSREAGPDGAFKERLERYERSLVLEALERTDWNRSRAARDLGLSRKGLKNKVERYGLDRRRGRRTQP